jgi:hypothetical protein
VGNLAKLPFILWIGWSFKNPHMWRKQHFAESWIQMHSSAFRTGYKELSARLIRIFILRR